MGSTSLRDQVTGQYSYGRPRQKEELGCRQRGTLARLVRWHFHQIADTSYEAHSIAPFGGGAQPHSACSPCSSSRVAQFSASSIQPMLYLLVRLKKMESCNTWPRKMVII